MLRRYEMTRTMICGAFAALMITVGPARSQAEPIRPPAAVYAVSQGLTTHGHGEIKVKPDIARLTADVLTHDRHQEQAVQDNARRMTALVVAIKGMGIADKDIQTQSYTVSPQYDYTNGQTHLTGYQVTNSVQVTLRDLKQVGTLIDTATQAGANQLDGVSYDLSDRTAAQDKALALAVADAQRRAATMASALGMPLGNPLSLSDGEQSPIQPIFMSRMQGPAPMSAASQAPPTPIAGQDITVTADVTLVSGI